MKTLNTLIAVAALTLSGVAMGGGSNHHNTYNTDYDLNSNSNNNSARSSSNAGAYSNSNSRANQGQSQSNRSSNSQGQSQSNRVNTNDTNVNLVSTKVKTNVDTTDTNINRVNNSSGSDVNSSLSDNDVISLTTGAQTHIEAYNPVNASSMALGHTTTTFSGPKFSGAIGRGSRQNDYVVSANLQLDLIRAASSMAQAFPSMEAEFMKDAQSAYAEYKKLVKQSAGEAKAGHLKAKIAKKFLPTSLIIDVSTAVGAAAQVGAMVR